MVSEIRVYVEGGGDDKETKARFRQGFGEFLRDLVCLARSKRIRWQIIACGGRDQAFSDFATALKTHSEAFNVLLVDAEGPVNNVAWLHLRQRDGWTLSVADDEHCHLMVQMMEAWLAADIEALKHFYGQGFREKALPRHADVEEINKRLLISALEAATGDTTKGKYHKGRHAPQLLERLDAVKVRRAALHCDRLFTTLSKKMEAM
jgi:hypothetical protein